MTVLPQSLQRAMLEAAVPGCVDFLLGYIAENRDRLVERAIERASSAEAREYGDRSWHLHPMDLLNELDDEIADALVYAGMDLQRPLVQHLAGEHAAC